MAKDTYYFPHDFCPTDDPKIMALLSMYGSSGYGLYWRIVEMLHSDTEHRLPNKIYLFLAIAKQMDSTAEFVSKFIADCIDVFELFVRDGEFILCPRVLRNIENRERKTNIAKANGSKGGIAKAKQNLAVAKQNVAIKGKERKGKETIAIAIEQQKSEGFIDFQNWIEDNCPNVGKMKEPFTEREADKILQDYSAEQVQEILKRMHNWKDLLKKNVSAHLTCFNWLRREYGEPKPHNTYIPVKLEL